MSVDFFAKVYGKRTLHSSDIPMHFPAGEAHVVDHEHHDETPLYAFIRGTNADDYVTAAMWIDLQHQRGHKVAALIPYLPGARQDRGRPFGAKVYADLINMMQADQVVAFDPHSPVMPGLVNNITVVEPTEAIVAAVGAGADCEYAGVICPDEGAKERAGRAAQAMGVPVYYATKKRDFNTGTLSGFECEDLPNTGKLLVVDDICDGGRTFTGLAEATGLPPERLGLWVSHGVFSGNNTHLLRRAYGDVNTTNSHPGHRNGGVYAYAVPVLPYLVKEINL